MTLHPPSVTDAGTATEVAPGEAPMPQRARGRRRRRIADAFTGYAFLGPSLVLLGLFVFVPLGWAFLISLQQTDGFGAGVFVGLDNYRRLLTDAAFWRAAGNTGLFTLIGVDRKSVV